MAEKKGQEPVSHHSTCERCGVLIVWGTTDTGERIPLDTRFPTYLLVIHDGTAKAARSRGYVDHASICS